MTQVQKAEQEWSMDFLMDGLRAGAGYCVGVLSGNDDQARLIANGADDVIDSVVDLLGFDLLVTH